MRVFCIRHSDHHFMMLHHRSFERWKERHQCKFELKSWGARGRENVRVTLKRPPLYSKRIQSTEDGTHWHFPLACSDKWLCVYKKSREEPGCQPCGKEDGDGDTPAAAEAKDGDKGAEAGAGA